MEEQSVGTAPVPEAAPPADPPAVEALDLHVRYHAQRAGEPRAALDGVTLNIPPGQTVALLGPNGSGKSTLLSVIASLFPPDSGSVRVLGTSSAAEARMRLGVVFQSPSLDPLLTVEENLRHQAALYGMRRDETRASIAQDLDRAQLAERAGDLVRTLSGGLARRVDLVRALLHRPRVLLLDEPTVGLDPIARERFIADVLRESREHALTILMSTHLIDEADQCDRVIMLHRGRIAADGPPNALRSQLGSRRVTITSGDPRKRSEALAWRRGWAGWSAPLPDDADELRRVVTALTATGASFSIAAPTLADVFEHFTGERLDDGNGRAHDPETPAR